MAQVLHRGRTFEFKVLPFGLSTSPRVYARVVKVVAEYLRPRGYTLFVFLDDFLVINPSREGLLRDMRDICCLLGGLGFLINTQKSSFTPSQRVQFLGPLSTLWPEGCFQSLQG